MHVGNLYDFYMRVDSESAQPKRTEKKFSLVTFLCL